MSEAFSPLPVGSKLLLWRKSDGWVATAHYPVGYQIPATAMPVDLRTKKTLLDAYDFITQHHADDYNEKGHPPAASEPLGNVPAGTALTLEKRSDGWHAWFKYDAGGISGRAGSYRSIGEAFAGLKMQYAIE